MKCSRDSQRTGVYTWEDQFVRGKFIPYADIPAYVSKIWEAHQLKWPPLVGTLHTNDRHAGKANRGHVYFPEYGANEQTILHELAHSMTSTHNDQSNGHGAEFVGLYMHLMCQHLSVPLPLMMYTAERARIKFDLYARPWCGS